MSKPFDAIAQTYDHWYDTPEGQAIFNAELKCLMMVCQQCQGRWLEIGVGTGRFAHPLGIAEGIDISAQMLEMSASRGIKTYLGNANDLPFPDNSIDGILLAMTLCFMDEPKRALNECHRTLKSGGKLLVGFIPSESPWGQTYEEKKKQGHPVYSYARFHTTAETVELIENNGFKLQSAASTLMWNPDKPPEINPRFREGMVQGAGFLALLFMNI